MRKLLATLLAVILVFSLIPATAYATQAPTFTLSTEANNLKVGDTFTVSVDLSGNTGFISMKLGLSWNDKVVTYKSTDLTDSIIAGATVNSKKPIVTYASAAVNNANGKVFSATFEVIAEGDCNIAIRDDNEEFFDANQTAVNVTLDSSTLESLKANPAVTKSAVNIADGIVGGDVYADKDEAEAGATITLSNVPAEGYTFGSYSVVDADGETVPVNADGTFTMPASNVTVSATFTANQPSEPAAKGYSVSLQCTDNEIIAAYGDTPEKAAVTVGVSNTEEEIDTYNAYNLFLKYPEGLTLESYTGSGVKDDSFEVKHDATARTIQVIGYGADKNLNQSPVTLYFSGAAVGEYPVTLTEAYMDAAGNANADDAPEATIKNDTVTVKVTGYKVTLDDGLSAESEVAVPGQDFTFRATDYNTHNYEVTAMIGDKVIDVTDNNGTYTIEGEDITGNINITATMNPKSYKVFINNVEAVNKATYNTPYTFDAAKEGHTIKSVTAMIGEANLTLTNNNDGTYTITGTDITGEITITIEWDAITSNTVTVNSTGAPGFSGDGSATKGEPYTFSFTEPEKYTYTDLKVVVGEGENAQDITDKLIKNEDGSYTIPANLITGPITITVTQTEINPLAVEVAQYVKLSDSQSIWLVTASGVPDGKIAKYNGLNMYWSAKKQVITVDENGEETQTTGPGYGAYAYLVIAGGSDDEVLAEAMSKVTVADKGQETIVTVDYSGDVNCSNKPDINDAQLVYNMYNAHYSSFDENAGGASMLKFLKADLNGDKGLGTQDALVVVNTILSTNNT